METFQIWNHQPSRLHEPHSQRLARVGFLSSVRADTVGGWLSVLRSVSSTSMAPIVLTFLETGYVAYRLFIHRRNFRKLVNNSDSALTVSRFIRLGLMSLAIFLVSLPFTFYQLVVSIRALGPYRSFNWQELRQYVS